MDLVAIDLDSSGIRGEYLGKGDLSMIRGNNECLVLGLEFIPGMLVECWIYVPKEYWLYLFSGDVNEAVVDQMGRMASVKGIMGRLVGLPDVHAGKGFPVGVSAWFEELSEGGGGGEILPEAIGSDVNCGVRIWQSNVRVSEFLSKQEEVLAGIKEAVPIQIRNEPSSLDMKRVLVEGLGYLESVGIISREDRLGTDMCGEMSVSSYKIVGQKARFRGSMHMGTLGGGNHYLEFLRITDIFAREDIELLGMSKEVVYVAVHTGSRGIASRALTEFMSSLTAENGLVGENPVRLDVCSSKGEEYLELVAALANYAFCNRTMIGKAVENVLGTIFTGAKLTLISDSPHNLITKEKINTKPVLSLRKGSTKVHPPFSATANQLFPSISPVFVGGSMTTGGYLIKAGHNSQVTNHTTCHGSGRLVRRKDARTQIALASTLAQIEAAAVLVHADSLTSLPEESQDVYKSIDKVVDFCETTQLSQKICKLTQLLVLKG
ncbi:tRNA-splicing ligase RtcB (3'-phosphate/5'-hydroxy nucleic acid ligase) [Nematocida homosporus]|uniref:tRNA-splicing ligase RtcB (3'-phosphate/5'-hydroxy nucleic acid ligase) n=1 Tax=Nematocida homosporus TaxID=1912981 RepID=UPI00221F76B7|nr:tRNA-splicing ligase RtcB (3'-phosphate/5'-hydroxy nucleic acid ligase) [Nematocida homosporus]KAI5186443.1 tRNA-splicing ligase RtcB (3'-phosphate/5'-hydroxy nucleic acid ligase) [Nematocida homosporus]